MITIKNIEKLVGTKIKLQNFNVPKDMLEWECERVIEFPGDVTAVSGETDESYRFEYKAVSDYDVPLCIYLRRTPDESGIYKMENNLMDGMDWIRMGHIKEMKIFQKNLEMYATEVIMRWAKDQNLI
jgi:hypothetical protein